MKRTIMVLAETDKLATAIFTTDVTIAATSLTSYTTDDP